MGLHSPDYFEKDRGEEQFITQTPYLSEVPVSNLQGVSTKSVTSSGASTEYLTCPASTSTPHQKFSQIAIASSSQEFYTCPNSQDLGKPPLDNSKDMFDDSTPEEDMEVVEEHF